ncbi:MAG: hypothetical protein R3Y58_07590 [Eubacteriales bacterium]
MAIENLRVLFGCKIYGEYAEIKSRVLGMTKEEIYKNSYYIDSMISLYEMLLDMSQQMEEGQLISLLIRPHLLTFLYDRWLKVEDSTWEEMKICTQESIALLERKVA